MRERIAGCGIQRFVSGRSTYYLRSDTIRSSLIRARNHLEFLIFKRKEISSSETMLGGRGIFMPEYVHSESAVNHVHHPGEGKAKGKTGAITAPWQKKRRSQSMALHECAFRYEEAVSFTRRRKNQNYRISKLVGYNKNGGICAAISGRMNQRSNTEKSWRPQCFKDCLCYVRVRLSVVCLIPMPVFYTVRCLGRVHDTHAADLTGTICRQRKPS